MSKTLLLVKLLVGSELRDRALVSQQSVYATLSLNQEVEVRSATIQQGGRSPEWNQLFLLEVGPWWRGKELVVQVFARHQLRADAFIGGASCKLGDLVRAVGLDEDATNGNGGGAGGAGASSSGGADRRPSFSHSHPMPHISGRASTAGATFQRVTQRDLRSFGELLPVLPSGGAANSGGGDGTEEGSSIASVSLPITWLLLRHGGGAAKLKQYPLPAWSTPAGRVAIYMDFVVLPAARARAPGLANSVLPAAWASFTDNEKLAWTARYRLERTRPTPAAGGVLGFVSAVVGAAPSSPAGGSAPGSPAVAQRYSVYGRKGVSLSVGGAQSSGISLPWPLSALSGSWDAFQRATAYDRAFYAYFFVLAISTLISELCFDRTNEVQPPHGYGSLDASESGASLLDFLPFSSTLARLFPLALGILTLQLAWNMLHDEQLSHPWRRLDVVLALILGVALGASSQLGPGGPWRARALGALALAGTHAYARAALFGPEVVAGIVSEQSRLAVLDAVPGDAPDPLRVPMWRALVGWTIGSLHNAWRTGIEWVTGQMKHEMPPQMHLALRSAFFLLGQVAAQWVFLDSPTPIVRSWIVGSGSAEDGLVQDGTSGGIGGEYSLHAGSGDDETLAGSYELTLGLWSYFLLPCFAYLLIFMFIAGKDAPLQLLRGRPCLALLALNTVAFAYGAVQFLPRLALYLLAVVAQTLARHAWGLVGLALDFAIAPAFLPAAAFRAAAAAAAEHAAVAHHQTHAATLHQQHQHHRQHSHTSSDAHRQQEGRDDASILTGTPTP